MRYNFPLNTSDSINQGRRRENNHVNMIDPKQPQTITAIHAKYTIQTNFNESMRYLKTIN